MLDKKLTSVMLILLAVCGFGATAQDDDTYRFDIGAGIGVSGYLGDANGSNMFKRPGIVGDVALRYLFNERMALRTQVSLLSLSGNTADFDNVLPNFAQYSFKSTVYDIGARGEFNFFPYGIGETYKRLKRVSPYLALGVGLTVSDTGDGTFFAFNIPMGFGVKYKVTRRLNMIAEFAMTKVFGDHVDSEELSDLYGIKSSFMKNTDWYGTITVGFSYEFGPRCVVCNRVD